MRLWSKPVRILGGRQFTCECRATLFGPDRASQLCCPIAMVFSLMTRKAMAIELGPRELLRAALELNRQLPSAGLTSSPQCVLKVETGHGSLTLLVTPLKSFVKEDCSSGTNSWPSL
ncbi:unnamed protein product [Mortierella alpina]